MTQSLLIIEDEEVVARSLKQLIELRYDVEIHTAASVAESKKKIGEYEYDAMLVDYNLPDGTGYQMLLEMLDHAGWIKDCLLVFISGVSYVDMTPEFKESMKTFTNVHVRNKPLNSSSLYDLLDEKIKIQ